MVEVGSVRAKYRVSPKCAEGKLGDMKFRLNLVSTLVLILALILILAGPFDGVTGLDHLAQAQTAHAPPPPNRVASIFLSQDFINQQIAVHSKSQLIKDVKIELDPTHSQIFLRGRILVPTEEMRAVNLDPQLGVFRFQVTIKPETNKKGFLVLDFPLSETFFYPESSKDPTQDRVIIPVQLLSLALASTRGYLAALSGDFSGFDRRSDKLTALLKNLDRSIRTEKNVDALEELKNQRAALKLQVQAIPVERKQLQTLSKEVEHILGFTGEKELNFNEELAARRNALILKIKLAQLAPYLKGVDLAGIRILHDKKDGAGENYLAFDVDSQLNLTPSATAPPRSTFAPHAAGLRTAPALIIRLNQSLFESTAIIDAEKEKMSSSIRNLTFNLSDDGLHVAGDWHKFFFTVPFDAVIDFVTTGTDVFEVRMRKLDVAGINLESLSSFVLESLKTRLDHALHGTCTFTYVGKEADNSRALQVNVDAKALVPAFPDLHLVDVDVRDQEFLLKIGVP